MTSPWNLPCDPIEALREGDSGPFEAFVPLGMSSLTGFFRRKGAGLEEAEDLSQEVLMKLIQNLDNYQPDGRFAAYVFRVGRNAWIDSRRRAGARPKWAPLMADDDGLAPPEPADPAAGPTEGLELQDEADQVREALDQLSEAHREVFELGVIQELPYAEVAAALGIPVGTVKSRMFHALRSLREALGVPEESRND